MCSRHTHTYTHTHTHAHTHTHTPTLSLRANGPNRRAHSLIHARTGAHTGARTLKNSGMVVLQIHRRFLCKCTDGFYINTRTVFIYIYRQFLYKYTDRPTDTLPPTHPTHAPTLKCTRQSHTKLNCTTTKTKNKTGGRDTTRCGAVEGRQGSDGHAPGRGQDVRKQCS